MLICEGGLTRYETKAFVRRSFYIARRDAYADGDVDSRGYSRFFTGRCSNRLSFFGRNAKGNDGTGVSKCRQANQPYALRIAGATSDDGDPIVLYDSLADRWLISRF